MDSIPFIGDWQIAAFGIVDPFAEESFEFNNFKMQWKKGMPPHYEPLLYVQVDGKLRFIGRYIKQFQVNIS